MGIGGAIGGLLGAASVTVRGAIKIREIDHEVSQITLNANRIMNLLFRIASQERREEGLPYYCPISNQLMLIPVSTGCNTDRDERGKIIIDPDGNISRSGRPHVFDYNALRNHQKNSSRCPFPGCEEILREGEVFFEHEVREGINRVMNDAVRWITLQRAEHVDYSTMENRLLEDIEGIASRIINQEMTKDDLSLLSYLIRKACKKYNNSVSEMGDQLREIILKTRYDDVCEKESQLESVGMLVKMYLIQTIKEIKRKDMNEGKEQ